jgi:hypothetical protein
MPKIPDYLTVVIGDMDGQSESLHVQDVDGVCFRDVSSVCIMSRKGLPKILDFEG